MPSGEIHRKYHKLWQLPVFSLSTVLLGGTAIYLSVSDSLYQAAYVLEFWFWINFWYAAGKYTDPDDDQTIMTSAEGRITREFGLLGAFIFGYTSFYAAFMNWFARKLNWFVNKGYLPKYLLAKGIFGAHQSWLTHSPIGTLIRVFFVNAPLAYLYQIVSVGLLAFDIRIEFSNLDLLIFFAAQLIGLGIADGIHVYLDSRE